MTKLVNALLASSAVFAPEGVATGTDTPAPAPAPAPALGDSAKPTEARSNVAPVKAKAAPAKGKAAPVAAKGKAAPVAAKGKAAPVPVIATRRASRIEPIQNKLLAYLAKVGKDGATVAVMAKRFECTEREVRLAIDRARNQSVKITRTSKNTFAYSSGFNFAALVKSIATAAKPRAKGKAPAKA